MAGPKLTRHLDAGDFDTYRSVVREYNHDAVNAVGPVTPECSILIRITEKFAPEDIYTKPQYYGESAPLAAEANTLLTAVTGLPLYFGLADAANDPFNRDRWKPYDASAWDKMIADYTTYLTKQLQPVLPFFERLKRLEEESAIRTDGKGAPIAKSRYSISHCIGRLEELLTPESWDEHLDKWLERISQKRIARNSEDNS